MLFCRKINVLRICITLILLGSCGVPTPRPIKYGEDACHYCQMIIVQAPFTAQLLEKKGKIRVYDAIECMVEDYRIGRPEDVYRCVVALYDKPSSFIDASKAAYLQSAGIPSPMAANISAYTNKTEALNKRLKNEGQVYDWQGLQEYLRRAGPLRSDKSSAW